jgi:hypothetical protein
MRDQPGTASIRDPGAFVTIPLATDLAPSAQIA